MRRFQIAGLVLATWFLAGLVLPACAGSLPIQSPVELVPLAPTAAAPAMPLPTQVIPHAVWVWGNSGLNAVDTASGKLLDRTGETVGERTSSRDKRRQFLVTVEKAGDASKLYLTRIDVARGQVTGKYFLEMVEHVRANPYENLSVTAPLLSADEGTVYVTLSDDRGKNWQTRVLKVDLTNGEVVGRAIVFDAPMQWAPAVTSTIGHAEHTLIVARTFQSIVDDKSLLRTRIALLSLPDLRVSKSFDAGKAIDVDSLWSNLVPATDGRSVYLLQSMWNDSSDSRFRFLALDLSNGHELHSTSSVIGPNGTACGGESMEFAPDGRDLWNLCGPLVQFLDPGTGLITTKVNLLDGKADWDISESILAKDGKTLYVVFPSRRQVVVFDLYKREVIQSARLREQSSLLEGLQYVSGWFVHTAQAKFLARPAVVLAPDESWIAFADWSDYLNGDGLWVVDTSHLKPVGHWLKGKAIVGVRAVSDGTGVIVLQRNSVILEVVDPNTGRIDRSIKFPLNDSSGFIDD